MIKFSQYLENTNSVVWAVGHLDNEGRFSYGIEDYYATKDAADKAAGHWTTQPRQVNVIGGPIGNTIYRATAYAYGDMGDRGDTRLFARKEDALKFAHERSVSEVPIHKTPEDATAHKAKEMAAWKKRQADFENKYQAEAPKRFTEFKANMKSKFAEAMKIIDAATDEKKLRYSLEDWVKDISYKLR